MATAVVSKENVHQQIGGFNTYCRVILPMQMENLVLSLVNLSCAEDIQNIEISYPRDWWEALKARFAPQWFLGRYPIRNRNHTVDIKAIWKGFTPDPRTLKHGPFVPYVLARTNAFEEDL